MDINSILYAEARQLNHSVYSNGDADAKLKMSLLGQLYVADWKYLMAAAGRMYKLSMGTIGGDGDITLVGNGTVMDLDQPSAVIAVDTGYRLIPIEFEVDCLSDMDAYDDELDILLTADRTQAVAAGATATVPAGDMASVASIQNLLDGGDDFPGRAYGVVTADITNPVHSEVLAYKRYELTQVAAETAGSVTPSFHYHKEFHYPTLLNGPCSILAYIFGTNATTFIGSLTVGAVPAGWFPIS